MGYSPDLIMGAGIGYKTASPADCKAVTLEAANGALSEFVHQVGIQIQQASTQQTETVFRFGQPGVQNAATAQVFNQASEIQQLQSLGWDVPQSVSLASQIQIERASTQLSSENQLAANTPTIQLTTRINTPVLGVDPYQIRPVVQGVDLSSFDADFVFDASGYIPSSVFNWGGEDLTKRAALPLYLPVALAQRQPPEKGVQISTPWDTQGQVASPSIQISYPVQEPLTEAPDANSAETHIIMNSVQIFDLPNEIPLALADISIDLDRDSATWQLSATALNQASADLLKRDATGRKELAIVINGYRWEFFISAVNHSKTVSNDKLNQRWKITGVSRAQYLGSPYAPKRTRSIGTTTAVQAATDELTGTGFTLDWDTLALSDWTMANAAFSYQEMTMLAVIKQLASAAGAVVQTDPATDTLIVEPRFKALPWSLSTATVDATIHESQIINPSTTDEPGTLFNQVFVSGQSEGVSILATRYGTSGDSPASDVVEEWITAIECNQARAAQVMAASGDRVQYSYTLQIPETGTEPGLLLPGMVVEVAHWDSADDFRAYVDSVKISVPGRANARIRQTVTLDRPIGWEELA